MLLLGILQFFLQFASASAIGLLLISQLCLKSEDGLLMCFDGGVQ
jgi:hypothetical protein